jgi:hypothetical protein
MITAFCIVEKFRACLPAGRLKIYFIPLRGKISLIPPYWIRYS